MHGGLKIMIAKWPDDGKALRYILMLY